VWLENCNVGMLNRGAILKMRGQEGPTGTTIQVLQSFLTRRLNLLTNSFYSSHIFILLKYV